MDGNESKVNGTYDVDVLISGMPSFSSYTALPPCIPHARSQICLVPLTGLFLQRAVLTGLMSAGMMILLF